MRMSLPEKSKSLRTGDNGATWAGSKMHLDMNGLMWIMQLNRYLMYCRKYLPTVYYQPLSFFHSPFPMLAKLPRQ